MTWVEEEFKNIDFNDQRINKRFLKITEEFLSSPSDPINSAMADSASVKAAYRFFDNPKVESQKILEPHIEATRIRAQKYERVLVVQDTTFVDFTSHKKVTGIGRSHRPKGGSEVKGIPFHAGLVLNDKGLPLGLSYANIWKRKSINPNESKRRRAPIGFKESYRWIDCIEKSSENLNNKQIIAISDREGDIHEAYEKAYEKGIDVIIRTSKDRYLEDDSKISELLGSFKEQKKYKIKTPKGFGSGEKKVELELRYGKVVLANKPNGVKTPMNKNRSELELFVVNVSNEKEKLCWTLLTTLPLRSREDAIEVINFYKARWQVEIYFKALKTGAGAENCHMSDVSKLVKYISLKAVIAWRLYMMSFASRESPESNCESLLRENEWKVAWLLLHRSKLKSGKMSKSEMPSSPPTIAEAVHWIAGIGGFLRRKSDGEPGFITFWRGWSKLEAALEVYELF